MTAKPARAKTMQLLPMGTKTEEAWRMVNEIAPDRADALAVSAFRYALTGEKADGPGVPPLAWKKSKGEIDLLLTRRAAGREGGLAKALATSLANGEPTLLPSSSLPEEKKTEDLKTEDSSFFGSSSSSDFGTWARFQEDPVAVALRAAGEGREKAGVYGARLKALKDCRGAEEGARLFVEECVSFVAEIEAGEEVRNRGKALVARLKGLANAPTATRPADSPPAPNPATPPGVSAMMDWDSPPPPAPNPAKPAKPTRPKSATPSPPVEPAPVSQTLAATVAAVASPFKRAVPPAKTEAEIEAERERQLRGLEELKRTRPELWKPADAAGAEVAP